MERCQCQLKLEDTPSWYWCVCVRLEVVSAGNASVACENDAAFPFVDHFALRGRFFSSLRQEVDECGENGVTSLFDSALGYDGVDVIVFEIGDLGKNGLPPGVLTIAGFLPVRRAHTRVNRKWIRCIGGYFILDTACLGYSQSNVNVRGEDLRH